MVTSALNGKSDTRGLIPTVIVGVVALMLSGCGVEGTTSTGNMPTDSTPTLGAATAIDGNLAPSIDAISLGCDLVLESIAVVVGETVSFTLTVDDESPLTMTYSISSDDVSVSDASVDENGVFTLNGLKPGTTTAYVTVIDENGASDQQLLSVVILA